MNKLTNNDIPLNDPYVYKFIGMGKTKGIFQIESPGMQGLMKQMYSDANKRISAIETKYQCTGFEHPFNKVKTIYSGKEKDETKIADIKSKFMEEMKTLGKEYFERLIAAISLYRPGPMDYIPDYIKGMQNPSAIVYDTPELEEILSGTYGVIVYQEQVQQIVRKLAGYSLGRGDLIRRAMGKKKIAIMDAEKEVFLYGNESHLKEGEAIVPGCIKNGIDEEAAKIIWDKMSDFAKYAFNKSHSAGYAVICIQTAWMKYYYPVDMLTATLNSVISKSDKLKVYVAEAGEMNIPILTPNVNASEEHYKIEGNGIRTGLMALRNMGKMAIPIIEERNARGEFKDIYDFINRMLSGVDKKVIEALTYAGALDTFGYSRAALITATPDIVEYTKYVRAGKFEEQPFNLPIIDKLYEEMGKIKIENCEEFERTNLLEKEYEYTGMYISGHPLDLYNDVLSQKGIISTGEIVPEIDEESGERPDSPYDGQSVQIAGVVRDLKAIVTKKGDKMYMLNVEDKEGKIKLVVFPKATKVIDAKLTLKESDLIMVAGKVQDSDRGCQLVVDDLSYVKDLDITTTNKVYIDCRTYENVPEQLVDFIKDNPGTTEVWVKTSKGWIVSVTSINLDWPNYIKLRNMFSVKLG